MCSCLAFGITFCPLFIVNYLPCLHSRGHIYCLIFMEFGQKICLNDILVEFRNWVTWEQKLGHYAKLKKKLVNTLEVKFIVQLS